MPECAGLHCVRRIRQAAGVTTPQSPVTAWLVLAVGPDRQHGGNDGYADSGASYYSWYSTVGNHSRVAAGDVIVLWDKRTLIGASVIESITTGTETKARYSCPLCGKASLKARKTKLPRWKCFKCGGVFDNPVVVHDQVATYRSEHAPMWTDLTDCLSGGGAARSLP